MGFGCTWIDAGKGLQILTPESKNNLIKELTGIDVWRDINRNLWVVSSLFLYKSVQFSGQDILVVDNVYSQSFDY